MGEMLRRYLQREEEKQTERLEKSLSIQSSSIRCCIKFGKEISRVIRDVIWLTTDGLSDWAQTRTIFHSKYSKFTLWLKEKVWEPKSAQWRSWEIERVTKKVSKCICKFVSMCALCWWLQFFAENSVKAIRSEKENLKASTAIVTRKLRAWATTTPKRSSVSSEIGRQRTIRQHRLAVAVSSSAQLFPKNCGRVELENCLCKSILLFLLSPKRLTRKWIKAFRGLDRESFLLLPLLRALFFEEFECASANSNEGHKWSQNWRVNTLGRKSLNLF